MTLHFNYTEADGLAFTEQFLRGSKSHRRLRLRVRWMTPLLLMGMAGFYTWRDGFSWLFFSTMGAVALLWWLFYPRRFDANVRKQVRKQMGESSYAKSFGRFELTLREENLSSTSPTGASTFVWSAVDRVEMDGEYLYLFLSGPAGYPMRIEEIGQEAAQSAYEFATAQLAKSRALDALPPR